MSLASPRRARPKQWKACGPRSRRRKRPKKLRRAASKACPTSPVRDYLADIPVALPALTRAIKLQEKASKVGFDWNDARLVLAKIREECDEVEEALDRGDKAHVASEIGDVLFAVANLARHVKTDAESALRQTNAKFERRFRHIEERLAAQNKVFGAVSLQEMDALWNEAKVLEV